MKTIEPTLPKEHTLSSAPFLCHSPSPPIASAENRPLSRRAALRLGLTATAAGLVGTFLAGCGGGSSKNTSNESTKLQFEVLWPQKTANLASFPPQPGRLIAPLAARSLRVDFEGATAGSSFTEFINWDNGNRLPYQSAREIDLSAAISSPLGFRVAEAYLTLTFYAGQNGTGGKISQVKVNDNVRFKINIGPGDGYPLDDHKNRVSFPLVNKVASIKINPGQSVPQFIQKTLTLTAKDTDGSDITLAPGTVTLTSLDTTKIKLDAAGLQIVGISPTGSTGTGVSAALDTGAGIVSSDSNPPDPNTVVRVIVYPQIAVAINAPEAAKAPLGAGGTRQFTATVKYQGLDAEPLHETSAVMWKVASGPQTVAIDPTSGLFTAPPNVSGDVQITAVSVLEAQSGLGQDKTATLSDTIKFTIFPTLGVTLSGSGLVNGALSATLPASAPNLISTTAFHAATIDGSLVDWSVVEPGGGTIAPSVDTFDATYTAPMQSGVFHVRGTSRRDPALYQEVTVTVQAVNVQAIVE